MVTKIYILRARVKLFREVFISWTCQLVLRKKMRHQME